MVFFDILQSSENFAIASFVLLISAGLVLGMAPAFRLTIPNLIVFLIGGFAGLLTVLRSYNRLIADLPNPPNGNLEIIGSVVVMLFGAIFGGSLLVWLKTRFPKSLRAKRWILPVAQFIVGLAMVPEVLTIGVPGVLGSLGMSVKGHFNAELSALPDGYSWGLLVGSASVDIAAILSLIGAAISLLKPSRLGVRFCIVGTTFYWTFIAALLVVQQTLQIHLTLRYPTALDLMPYAIGIMAILIAHALYSYVRAREQSLCDS